MGKILKYIGYWKICGFSSFSTPELERITGRWEIDKYTTKEDKKKAIGKFVTLVPLVL